MIIAVAAGTADSSISRLHNKGYCSGRGEKYRIGNTMAGAATSFIKTDREISLRYNLNFQGIEPIVAPSIKVATGTVAWPSKDIPSEIKVGTIVLNPVNTNANPIKLASRGGDSNPFQPPLFALGSVIMNLPNDHTNGLIPRT